jgi:hypothetical protein
MFAMNFFQKRFFQTIAGVFFVSGLGLARADQVTAGSTVILSVSADGTSPFTYQWIKDGINMPGATGPTVTLANVQSANAGSYAVLVANAAGSTTSDVSTIAVLPATFAPVITVQPTSRSVIAGANVTFTVGASGTPAPTFQWKKNGTVISGATSSTFTLNAVQISDAATFTAVATNSAGSATSSGAVLTVATSTVAPVITTQPASQSVLPGANVTFTVAASGTPTPTFQWKKNGTVISGATSSTYTLNAVQGSTAGTYTAVATNSAGSATSAGAVLTVSTLTAAPVFTVQPESQSLTAGGNVTLTVAATGTPTPTFQWKKNGVNISGAVGNSYSIIGADEGDFGIYTVIASNAAGSVVSNPCMLSSALTNTGDFDGDGKSDLLLTNMVTGDRVMWLMNGSSVRVNSYLGNVPLTWSITGTGDFDGDGKADIFWTNIVTGDRAVWLMNGNTIKSGAYMGAVPLDWSVAGTGDFDGDGKADIIWSNVVTGERAIWLMNGAAMKSGASLGIVPSAWAISGTGDFDGDGKSDVLLTNTLTGDRVLWVMNGTTIKVNAYLGNVPTTWAITGTGDFDKDGKADILWSNGVTGDRSMWLMNGRTAKSGAYLGSVPTAWMMGGTGDFDGDGKADIFWSNTGTGDKAMWMMNGGAAGSGAVLGALPLEWSTNY